MTKLTGNAEEPLNEGLLEELRKLLARTMLFSDVREYQEPGLDGETIVMECIREGTYYMRSYWSPDLQPVCDAVKFYESIAPHLEPPPYE